MLSTNVVDNIRVKVVARDAYGLVTYDARKGNDGDFRRSSTDVDDHITHRLLHVYTNSHSGSHGFMDEINFLSASNFSRVAYSTFFHFRDARRNTDHHAKGREEPIFAVIDHLDHAPDHMFGRIKVSDDAVF